MPERIAGIFRFNQTRQAKTKTNQDSYLYGDQMVPLLLDPEIGYFDQVLVHEDLSKTALCQEIEALFNFRKPYDLILFFYIGPLLVDQQGNVYLATTDMQPINIEETAIPITFLSQWMLRSFSRRQVIFLDQYPDRSVNQVALRNKIRSSLRGNGTRHHVLMSDHDRDEMSDDSDQTSVKITELFIQGLQTGKADLDKDGVISTQDMHNYINRELALSYSQRHINLWKYSESELFILGNAIAGQPKKYLRLDVILRVLAAPAVILLIGWWADPLFAAEMAILFLLAFLAITYFGK